MCHSENHGMSRNGVCPCYLEKKQQQKIIAFNIALSVFLCLLIGTNTDPAGSAWLIKSILEAITGVFCMND
jgi:hypothetical protein